MTQNALFPRRIQVAQYKGRRPTISLLLPNYVLALPMQELQMVCHHSLLAFMDDFGIGAWVQVLPTSHFLVFQPAQNLKEENDGMRVSFQMSTRQIQQKSMYMMSKQGVEHQLRKQNRHSYFICSLVKVTLFNSWQFY